MSEQTTKYRVKGYWTDRLLTDFFKDTVLRYPNKVAIVDERFGPLTYSQLSSFVTRLSAALEAQGIGREDKFIIALPNWHHVSVFVLALGTLGAICVHMPVTGREHEFNGILKVTGAKGIVVPEEFHGFNYVSMIEKLSREFMTLGIKVAVGNGSVPLGWTTYDRLLSDISTDGPKLGRPPKASDITCVLFTSGASGNPKGVVHSSNTIGALNTTVAQAYSLSSEDVIFMGAPLGYSAGLVHGVRLAIYLGAKLVLLETWEPRRALELMAKEKATYTLMTPTLLRDLLESEALLKFGDRLSLRILFCGGTYVTEGLLRLAHEKLPKTFTAAFWGMTEGIGSACRFDSSQECLYRTDGRPFPGTELKVLTENGTEAPTDVEGELVMRGPQLCLEYHEQPKLNKEAFGPGGWFRTGDLATINDKGYLKITGRSKEIIIRGGANISPGEIEAKLVNDPRIHQLAIVDMPDERLGERVCACLVPHPEGRDLTLEDIVEIARKEGLAKNKWPERLEIMESLPADPAGKLHRPALRDYIKRKIESEV